MYSIFAWNVLHFRSPDSLVVSGFLPSAIAVSRLRRIILISPPKQKYPLPLAPQTQNPRTATGSAAAMYEANEAITSVKFVASVKNIACR